MTNHRNGLQHVSQSINTILERCGVTMNEEMNVRREIEVRPGLDFDRAAILEIERKCFDVPMSSNELRVCLNKKEVFVDVAAVNKFAVCGFVIYEFTPRGITLINIAVDPKFRRIGVGKNLILSVCAELNKDSVTHKRIMCDVRETDFQIQAFLRKMAFRACGTKPKHFSCGTTAYFMQYQLGFEQVQHVAKNRFTGKAA